MRDSKPPLAVPTLMSERLMLEPLTRAHSDGIFALWSQAEVCRFSGPAHDTGGQPITLPVRRPSHSDKIIDFFLHGAETGERFRSRFQHARRVFGIRLPPAPRVLGPWVYMAEASRAALRWLRSEPDRERVVAFIAQAKVASIKLAMRLGLRATGGAVDGAASYEVSLAQMGA